MATHNNLIVESDMRLSTKIGRVLVVDLDENPNVVLKKGDVIKKDSENLLVKLIEDFRLASKFKIVLGVRVENI